MRLVASSSEQSTARARGCASSAIVPSEWSLRPPLAPSAPRISTRDAPSSHAASSASSVSVASLSCGERATRTPCAANASTSSARSVSKSPTIRWRVRPSGAAARAPPSTPITRSASDQPGHAASSAARVGWSPPARISARRCPHSLSHRAPASPFAGMTRIRFVGSRVLPFLSALWRSPVAMR